MNPGWRTVAYVALLLGIFGAAVTYAGPSAMPTPDVEQEFYIACAQVLPVLLLAHIVRLSSVRNGLFAARARGSEIRQKVVAMAEDVESTVNDEGQRGVSSTIRKTGAGAGIHDRFA